MPFGVRGILGTVPQNIYCLYSACTEILRNKKVNIPFALQPSFLGFLETKIFFYLSLVSKSQFVIRQVVSEQS